MIHRHIIAALFAALVIGQTAWAQTAQEYVGDDGRTYRETRQTYKRPVSQTTIEEHPYTVYTQRMSTEYHPSSRTVYTPVTEYQWEPYLANRWNPFSSPSVQYRYVPRTRWEVRNEQVHIPVTRNEMVPEQRISRVPVTRQAFEDVEHITRVAVSGSGSGSDPFAGGNSAIATRPIGSTGQLSSGDPPRQATTTANAQWKR